MSRSGRRLPLVVFVPVLIMGFFLLCELRIRTGRLYSRLRNCDIFFSISIHPSIAGCTRKCGASPFLMMPEAVEVIPRRRVSFRGSYNGKAFPSDGSRSVMRGRAGQVPTADYSVLSKEIGTDRHLESPVRRVLNAAVSRPMAKRPGGVFRSVRGRESVQCFQRSFCPNDTVDAFGIFFAWHQRRAAYDSRWRGIRSLNVSAAADSGSIRATREDGGPRPGWRRI